MCNIMNLYMYICCKSFKVYHPPFFLASSAPKSPNFTTNIHTQDAPPPKKKKKHPIISKTHLLFWDIHLRPITNHQSKAQETHRGFLPTLPQQAAESQHLPEDSSCDTRVRLPNRQESTR